MRAHTSSFSESINMKSIIALIVLIALSSCGLSEKTAPAALASSKANEAAQLNHADYQHVVNLLIDNLVVMFNKQCQLLTERELAKINQNPDENTRMEQAAVLLNNQEQARLEFFNRANAKRSVLLNAPNFKLAEKLTSAVQRYMGDIDASAHDIDNVLSIFDSQAQPQVPATQPASGMLQF